jgi:hypothetical protein
MNRAAILTNILKRNALRREAHLPPLDVAAEYHRAVAQAHWQEVCGEHYDRVREEVVERLRHTHGRDYRLSAGGRWMIEAMTLKELASQFGGGFNGPGTRLGYAGLDAALPQNLSPN